MVPSILYVEDNDDIREITSHLLASAGYSITPTANGVEALECYTQRRFDLIITDIFMPEMDGNEFIQKLGEQGNVVPILVLTYSVCDIIPNPIITVMATKPLTFNELCNSVVKALSGGGYHRHYKKVAS